MAEAASGPEKYAGNSNRDKAPDETPAKKVEKIVEGKVVQRKKSLGRRLAENFKGEDAGSVGTYVVEQVLVPRIKDLVFDIIESAVRRALFGDSAKGYTSRSGTGKGYTPYNTIASSAISKQAPASQQQVRSDEFGEIVVETRGEAQEVMDKISNLIETYGMACVSDLKAAVGLTPSITDERFGWLGMGGTDIRRVGGASPGYLLVFPRPEELP